MREKATDCWACGSLEVIYTDVINAGWCEGCFNNIYLSGEGETE